MYSFKTTKEEKNVYKNVISTTEGEKEENIMRKKRGIVNTNGDHLKTGRQFLQHIKLRSYLCVECIKNPCQTVKKGQNLEKNCKCYN